MSSVPGAASLSRRSAGSDSLRWLWNRPRRAVRPTDRSVRRRNNCGSSAGHTSRPRSGERRGGDGIPGSMATTTSTVRPRGRAHERPRQDQKPSHQPRHARVAHPEDHLTGLGPCGSELALSRCNLQRRSATVHRPGRGCASACAASRPRPRRCRCLCGGPPVRDGSSSIVFPVTYAGLVPVTAHGPRIWLRNSPFRGGPCARKQRVANGLDMTGTDH